MNSSIKIGDILLHRNRTNPPRYSVIYITKIQPISKEQAESMAKKAVEEDMLQKKYDDYIAQAIEKYQVVER